MMGAVHAWLSASGSEVTFEFPLSTDADTAEEEVLTAAELLGVELTALESSADAETLWVTLTV